MRQDFSLELRCPQKVNEISVDPEPDWSFDSLILELNSLEKKLNASSSVPVSLTKTNSGDGNYRKGVERSPVAFVMAVSNDEMEDSESESETEEDHRCCDEWHLVAGKRFNFDDLGTSESDDSDHELALDSQSCLMNEVGLVESTLFELSHVHQHAVKEEIRNQISAIETELMRASEKSASALARVEKYREARREADRKFDTHYQRKIAEALDNHLTAIQRDHELKSQIEERKIRSDAAYEEAKRKEKALQEERLRQERARAEAEAKRRADEAKMAALEAERKAAKQAAENEAAEASKRSTAIALQEEAVANNLKSSVGTVNLQPQESGTNGVNKSLTAGDIIRSAESALNLEQGRLQKLKELHQENQSLMARSNMDFSQHERTIGRLIKLISGTETNIRSKASELLKIFNNPMCPQSICIAAFAKKVVSHWGKSIHSKGPDIAAFAFGHVIVLVTSKVPHAMDILLAELHEACIYTVPKHVVYSKSVFESKEAYYKAMGYQEDGGKLESETDYLKRLESYMKLYGALVQTEVDGVWNIHGSKEGWAWLARFLNTLPANIYSATALKSFLQVAGFCLYRKYKSQFRKLLDVISKYFLRKLRERQDPKLKYLIEDIQSYIEGEIFLQEPNGRRFKFSLLSKDAVPVW